MKAVMIVYNHGISEEVAELLEANGVRGFTRWEEVHGRGSRGGEPHLGTHVWPANNAAILAIVEDEQASPLLAGVRRIDAAAGEQGIRAFVWPVEGGA
jgi:nitrogen regulatory protein PII